MFRDAGFNASTKDISAITGASAEILGPDLQAALDSYIDPRVVSDDEARQELLRLGYTDPTQDEVNAFLGQRDEASTIASLREQYNPLATTVEEAQQMMRDLGYTNIADSEAQSLAGKIKEEDARRNIEFYVDQKTVSREEAERFFRDIGYNPTKEEIEQFVRQGASINQDAVKSELVEYTNPRMVDEQEVRNAYAELGLAEPTQADIDKLIGQYNQELLAGRSKENLGTAQFNSLTAKNKQMAALIGTQGRTANQSDIDALNQMLGGQRGVDLNYDVTGDKKITQDDIDFLSGVVGGKNTEWTAPEQSPWAATGLYGQIQANELQRQKDLAAAAQAADERIRQADILGAKSNAQTKMQSVMQQLESMQRTGLTPQPVPLVESSAGFDMSDPLNTGFFSEFQNKKAQQNQQPTTKIAAGGYIDDLLAGDMTADDLLNLLR
jgi:hypothetical protein